MPLAFILNLKIHVLFKLWLKSFLLSIPKQSEILQIPLSPYACSCQQFSFNIRHFVLPEIASYTREHAFRL